MFNKTIIVSGVTVKLRPYTEKRFKELIAINEEIQQYLKDNPNVTMETIADQRAEWYKRKSEILWEPELPLSVDFFKQETFESSMLKESEDFFLQNRFYL